MAVQIEFAKESTKFGTFIVKSENACFSADEWVQRIRAIISLIKAADLELVSKDDIYYIMDLLEDYMPTEEQAEKIFKK